jgi:hypothetical protein
MAGMVSGGGRALLVLGAAVLLASMVLPLPLLAWFTVSGDSPEFPEGSYTSFQSAVLLNSLGEGPWAPIGLLSYAGFGALLICATAGLAAAGMGRRTRNVGTLGIAISLLFAGLLYLTAYRLNLPLTGPEAAISIGYGFVAAIAGGALLEAGGRWPRAVAMRRPLPSVEYRKE